MFLRVFTRALLRAQRRYRRTATRRTGSTGNPEHPQNLALRRRLAQDHNRHQLRIRCRSSANGNIQRKRDTCHITSCTPRTVQYAKQSRVTLKPSGNATSLCAGGSAVRSGGRVVFSWFVSAFTAGFAAWMYAFNSTVWGRPWSALHVRLFATKISVNEQIVRSALCCCCMKSAYAQYDVMTTSEYIPHYVSLAISRRWAVIELFCSLSLAWCYRSSTLCISTDQGSPRTWSIRLIKNFYVKLVELDHYRFMSIHAVYGNLNITRRCLCSSIRCISAVCHKSVSYWTIAYNHTGRLTLIANALTYNVILWSFRHAKGLSNVTVLNGRPSLCGGKRTMLSGVTNPKMSDWTT